MSLHDLQWFLSGFSLAWGLCTVFCLTVMKRW